MTSGFLLINKPSGPTSHDVIDELRGLIGIKQIGHAGTLDPFASGLLLIGIGEATKLLRHYVGLDKKYEAILRLGATSDTYDRDGNIAEFPNSKFPACAKASAGRQIPNKFQISIRPWRTKIQTVLKSFIGKQLQTPPMYSAKKVSGKKLYELARQGEMVERKPVEIEVHDIKFISLDDDLLTLQFYVSSGTYIRSLAHDIGQKLETGAYLEELTRTDIGNFKLDDAIPLCHCEPPRFARGKLRPKGVARQSDSRTECADKIASLPLVARNDISQHLIPLKTVLVSGTFDGVHEGHRNYFQQARGLGQRLIAIVGRDKITEQIKGRKPKYSEKERIQFVKQCPEIDRVYLGVLDNVYDFIASLNPDIIALGYDQTAYTENLAKEMKNRGLNPKIVRLKPYMAKKYHNSIINKPMVDKKAKNI